MDCRYGASSKRQACVGKRRVSTNLSLSLNDSEEWVKSLPVTRRCRKLLPSTGSRRLDHARTPGSIGLICFPKPAARSFPVVPGVPEPKEHNASRLPGCFYVQAKSLIERYSGKEHFHRKGVAKHLGMTTLGSAVRFSEVGQFEQPSIAPLPVRYRCLW